MATKINISIPQPCHENWQAMTPSEKGRFCDSCQKNVFDFTTASDRQIIEAFNNNESLCGRFTKSQLNRDLVIPKEKNSIWLATTSVIVSLLGMGGQEVLAQGEIRIEQTDKKVIPENSTSNSNQEKEINGIVSDNSGPLPGVNVVIKGTTIGTQTDFDGKFSINAKENDILVFSFIGMKTNHIKVFNQSPINFIMQEDSTELQGGAFFTSKKRTFFGRIIHKIRNLFR